MLLRSSSTPILGSLLSSSSIPYFSESPKTTHHNCQPTTLQSFSCHFSPLSESTNRDPASSGFRRTRSDGNLHGLLSDHSDDSHHHLLPSCRCSSHRPNTVLENIPSFSIYNSGELEEEADLQDQEQEEENNVPQDPLTVGEAMFSFSDEKQELGCNGYISASNGKAPPLFLARGLGIDRVGSGLMSAGGIINGGGGGAGIGGGGTGIGDGGGHSVLTDNNGGNQSDLELYFKRMVEEDPSNPLFLRNYAQFLYQTKGDLHRAGEYYSRAILAEPGNGEILSQYAKLVWELHRDEERASSYFERAVQAAPQDSHVLAAYAGFLWETEDDDEVGQVDEPSRDYTGPSVVNDDAMASASKLNIGSIASV